MVFYGLIMLDKNGAIIAVEPQGVEFDERYLKGVIQEEQTHTTPHPNLFDLGGYYFHTLWTGIKPFIIAPQYLVGVVSDPEEDPVKIKKTLRKVANNVLLYYNNLREEFADYFRLVWNKFEANEHESIELLRPDQIVSVNSANSAQDSDSFDDLIAMSDDIESQGGNRDETLANASGVYSSASDPFGGSSAASDPFGESSSSTDPFGGSPASTDPFGGSSSVNDPFGGSFIDQNKVSGMGGGEYSISSQSPALGKTEESEEDLDYDPSIFGGIKVGNESASPDEFSENPWADESGTDEKKKDEIDPFDENPFG